MSVRSSVEKWLPAVTALYGLFGLSSLVVGKDTLAKVPVEGRAAVAIIVVIGLILTGLAIWFGYRAAYGWLKVHDVSDDARLQEWYRERRGAIKNAPGRLAWALSFASAAVAVLLLAIGVLWFWPPVASPSPIVDVSYRMNGDTAQQASVCGALATSEGALVRILTSVGDTKRTVPIEMAWIDKISVVDAC